ncbi:MAG: alanine--tRNA ligase [Peptoniphilus grossensis]|uniref:alanine--tRNA ligase n=1 Tax=Peptoniphilus grossensis TaxID=1465756 RepID=UPI00258E4E67|nr:alanine--tRNA ligase [Peptoniphilus grossensis]MDU5098971.1 alanine--tRNA ligase [Peptoniphilus grossensis]
MKYLGLHDIRTEFLKFFESKDHLILPSFSLIPKNDKSLLLIGAGMAPMKKFFTGEEIPPAKRVTTCQKCIRTGDIDNVGLTDRHATFFEMLGNFSFGDYFKHEVIPWAWEFLTVNLEIPKEDLWVTVYKDDDEAYNIWKDVIGIPEEKIIRLGKDDNFWELEVGPSGPCSEIYVDRGLEYGSADERPGGEGDRFIEVWNLVFTQFDKDEEGNYNPLSHPNIDTGMGLERIATVLQRTDNIFEIDAIKDIIGEIAKVSGKKYGEDKKADISFRVITDHIRAMTFMISDTIVPSNEGRGYVLRRLIRRAARHGRKLGIERAFLYEIADMVMDSWGDQYKELKENRKSIKEIIRREEEKFLETIDDGLVRLNANIEEMKASGEKLLDGKKAFKLYDTYGFPIDLTEEILKEEGFDVDMAGFEAEMEDQKRRAREAREDKNIGWANQDNKHLFEGLSNEFLGYEKNECQGNIIRIISDEDEIVDSINEGERGIVILDKTTFYGESGGQVGDTGEIISDEFKLKVTDTKKTKDGLHLHLVEVEEGKLEKAPVKAIIDVGRRNNIRRNHSVTHLLHRALKDVLGNHVNQAGSLVMPDRMRFDFSHFEAMSKEEIEEVEKIVNEKIFEGLPVETKLTNLNEAKEMGAIGLFEDKYHEEVRVLSMGDYSRELCGGTHVSNTSEISMFKILSESGISNGIRRIEAITGPAVLKYLNELKDEQEEIARELKSNKEEILQKIKLNIKSLKEANKEIEKLEHDMAKDQIADIMSSVKNKNGINYVIKKFEGVDVNTLRDLADEVRNKVGSVVVLFATVNDGKLNFVCAVSKDLVEKKIAAGKIIKEIAKVAGGGGGGRPDMATAGAKDINKVEEALNKLSELL